MSLTPYTEVLRMGKEAIAAMLVPVRAAEMKMKAELEIKKIDGKLIEQQQKIAELSAAYPLDFDRIINALDEFKLLERRQKQFGEIIAELFPQEKP